MRAVRSPDGLSRWRNRRREFLLAFGVAYVLIGFGYTKPIPNVESTAQAVAAGLAPLPLWGLGWALCGLTMLSSAARHWTGQQNGNLGFGLGAAVPTLWGMMAFLSWVVDANARAWVTALIFWVVSLSVGVVSGMVDPRFSVPR